MCWLYYLNDFSETDEMNTSAKGLFLFLFFDFDCIVYGWIYSIQNYVD